MRISGTPDLPAAAVAHGRPSGRPPAARSFDPTTASASTPAPEIPEAEATAESGRPHGLVRAAEHSNRSDVAALRQWINHPELRSELALPDLSAEQAGKGFARAVAAYEAVIAIVDPPAETADPVVTDPVVTDPVVTDPVVTDPVGSDPLVTEPPADPGTDPSIVIDQPLVEAGSSQLDELLSSEET